MTTTSSSLLDGLKANNQFAWDQFVERYQPLVWDICRRHGISSHDAKDVVQEVFLGVYRNFAGFDRHRKGKSFHAWLRGIARHKITDYFRAPPQAKGGSHANRSMHEVVDPCQNGSSDDDGLDPSSHWVHLAAEMVKAEFEPRTWQAFWRTAVEDRTTAEVASELGISPAAVRQAKCRVRRRLEQEMEGLEEGPAT